jgi:DNA-binding IclR family transcriptional regulator
VPAESSQTLDRGLRLLALVARSETPLTVTEVAARLGLSRTVVYRLLTTLQEHRLVGRRADGRVVLGLGVLGLAHAVHPLLRSAAGPVLRRLAEESGATAHLTVLEGADALAVAVVEPSWTDYHVGYRVGTRHAPDRGAAGRAILAGRRGEHGVVVTSGELQPGAQGVAAPVPDVEGLEASVGVVALADLDVDEVGPRVVAAAAELARALH